MPKIRYGLSYWVDRLPRRRRTAYPRQRGRLEVEVAIVGGGMAGCATAYALSAAGARVALLEATQVGQGAIGSSTALVMQEPEVDFQPLLAAHGLRAEGAIRMAGNTQIDPFRACLGLATAAVKRGAAVFERSPVDRIAVGRSTVELRTAGGTVAADHVVIATGHPGALLKPLARHFRAFDTYAVATPPLGARIRAELGRRRAMLWDTADPYHYLRWTRDDRIIFGGGDQPPPHRQRREKTLVQRTGQLMYELSVLYPVISGIQPEYAWTGPSVGTADGLPYVGPHRNYPRHLFALGFGGNGLAQGFLASRVLLRHYLGESVKGDELLGFTR